MDVFNSSFTLLRIIAGLESPDSGEVLFQFLTSKRLTEDQLPGVPEAALARARHHIVRVGSVLVENCEVVGFWFTS